MPLPSHLQQEKQSILNQIDPKKDVDCLTSINFSKLVLDPKRNNFIPCTPNACLEILKHLNIDLQGKKVLIINRSMIVGLPLFHLLLQRNATVQICHSYTVDLKSYVEKVIFFVCILIRFRQI